MKEIVITKTTQKLPDKSMLWCVVHTGTYYNDDEGNCWKARPQREPADTTNFIIATDKDEAIQKAESMPGTIAMKARPGYKPDSIEATIVTLESLIPTYDASKEDRMGQVSFCKLRQIELNHPEDNGYRLSVCIVSNKKT